MQRKHPNGGGVIRGDQAVVSPSAFVSPESAVMHGAHVTGRTRLTGKTGVGGTAVVHNSFVADSTVGKVLPAEQTFSVDGRPFQPTFPFVSNAHITARSRIENQFVLGEYGHCVELVNCWLEDATEVRDHVHLSHVHMMHFACVCGDATVEGSAELPITLDRRMYVHRGQWIVAPKYFEVGGADDGEGIHVGITECAAGRVNIGCFCVKVSKLRRSLDKPWGGARVLADKMGWQDYHLEQLKEGLLAWERETH